MIVKFHHFRGSTNIRHLSSDIRKGGERAGKRSGGWLFGPIQRGEIDMGARIKRIPRDLILRTDDYLDRLARSFEELKIRQLLGISYAAYINAPDVYDRLAQFMLEGNGFHSDSQVSGIFAVELKRAAAHA